jgi:hypothetical protein
MRTVVLGALALGSGCNWVFGLDPVTLTDAQINDAPPDAMLPSVKLSAITPMLTTAGATTGQATFVPISPPPRVQYGRRGEALTDATISGQDVFVGYDFAEATETWRLVYTLEGGVPHEVHWKPSVVDRPGHAVSLQLTPNDREAVPAPGVFRLNATGAPSNWLLPRVYTTNTWTVDLSPPPDVMTATQINSNFAGSFTKPMAGAKRKPDPAKDFVVLAEYDESAAANACTVLKGSAAFHIDLATGAGPAAPWTVNIKNGTYIVSGDGVPTIANLIGTYNLAGAADVKRYQVLTFGPGGSIPLHRHTEPGVPLPVPVGLLLAKCEEGPDMVPPFGFPSDIGLPTIGTLMYATKDLPIDGGPMVRNGLAQSIVGDMGPFNADLRFSAYATLPTIDGASISITGASTVAIPAGGATADLDFAWSVNDPVIELYEATLYKISGGALVPIREFTFTEKPLRFDRATGEAAGTRYVFQIRVIRGASANTVNADFTVWGNTQTLGVTYTQSFTLD